MGLNDTKILINPPEPEVHILLIIKIHAEKVTDFEFTPDLIGH